MSMPQPITRLLNEVNSKLKLNLHLLNNLFWCNIDMLSTPRSLQYWTVGVLGNRDLRLIAITQPITGLSNAVTSKLKLNWHLLNNF
jgi:hypothetical protein